MSNKEIDELKWKLEETDKSPNNAGIMISILRHPQVLETQDNLEEPDWGGDNNMLEAAM